MGIAFIVPHPGVSPREHIPHTTTWLHIAKHREANTAPKANTAPQANTARSANTAEGEYRAKR
jgi:hypothetical protein